jgi:branched-chain amino acid aminotransferase
VFGEWITTAVFADGAFTYSGEAEPIRDFRLHPATHVLHYGSACFEGLKGHRQPDGSVAVFRLDDHVQRLRQSAERLMLPVPDFDLARQMILDAVAANAEAAPEPPGSLYIRPTLIGTEQNIGAAARPTNEALLYILTSPVGDYFAGGVRPLTIVVETKMPRTTPQFGMVKSGANYAMALVPTVQARQNLGADQVLFAPNGDVTETGAANFFVIDDNKIVTRALDESFLHGVTRASLIAIANDLGYEVEERELHLTELLEWAERGEMCLTGTAAVIAPVGSLVIEGQPHPVGDGQPGPNTLRLRKALLAAQSGGEDTHNWRTTV